MESDDKRRIYRLKGLLLIICLKKAIFITLLLIMVTITMFVFVFIIKMRKRKYVVFHINNKLYKVSS